MAAQTQSITFTGADIRSPVPFNVVATSTDTITITITFKAPGKISDCHFMLPSGDTFKANLDFDGGATHTADIYSDTNTSGSALSGRSFETGQILVLSVTGGTSGAKAIAGQIEAHSAG